MTYEILVSPCVFYKENNWFAVKPVNPQLPLFYVNLNVSGGDARTIVELNNQISQRLTLPMDAQIRLRTVEAHQLFDFLTEEDKKLDIEPSEEVEHGNGD